MTAHRNRGGKRTAIAAGSILLLLFTLGPFVWMLWVSLASRPDLVLQGEATYGFGNYVNVLTSPTLHFGAYFRNSLIVAIVASVAVTAIASVAGYAVSRIRFPGRLLVPIFVLAMSMFPPISIVGYLYKLFAGSGLLNTHTALILPYAALTVSLGLWINMSYFAQIPVELDEAALVDGAGRLTALFRVVLPLALPGIFSAFLLVFIACFNEFLFALMLTLDPSAQTLPVGIALFEGLHGEVPWGNLMAASALATLPLVLLTVVFQRFIVQGLTGGAVKG